MKVTQYKYVEAPMNLGMSDRVALLNIVVRDMQAGGASIQSVLADGDGWRIEFMGAPESTPVEEEVSLDDSLN